MESLNMFDSLTVLFKDWDDRVSKDQKNNTLLKHEQDNMNIDKNSKNILNTILVNNMRHKKQDIPTSFKVNEDTGTIEDVNVLEQITPFTTDKTVLHKLHDNYSSNYQNSAICSNWSKIPKNTRYKMICVFIDNKPTLTDDTKELFKMLFKTRFDELEQYVTFDKSTRDIINIDFKTIKGDDKYL